MNRFWLCSVVATILFLALAEARQSDNGLSNSERPLRVRISQGVSAGLLIKKKKPHYPQDARRGGIEGTVVVQAVIDTKGNVKEAAVVAGHPALAPAALEAVKNWKYEPYLLNGQPVEFETQVVVAFQLSTH